MYMSPVALPYRLVIQYSLIIAKAVSKIGRPNAISETTIVNAVYALVAPSIDITDIINPRKYAPVEPMNIFAGLKLYGKIP